MINEDYTHVNIQEYGTWIYSRAVSTFALGLDVHKVGSTGAWELLLIGLRSRRKEDCKCRRRMIGANQMAESAAKRLEVEDTFFSLLHFNFHIPSSL